MKSIEFNFPIYRDGQEVRRLLWEKGNTVETCRVLCVPAGGKAANGCAVSAATDAIGACHFIGSLFVSAALRRERHAAPLQWRVRADSAFPRLPRARSALAMTNLGAVAILTVARSSLQHCAGSGMPLPYIGRCNSAVPSRDCTPRALPRASRSGRHVGLWPPRNDKSDYNGSA